MCHMGQEPDTNRTLDACIALLKTFTPQPPFPNVAEHAT